MGTMGKIISWVYKSIPLLFGIGIVIVLLLRIQVATQRFFDVDEFTHMHWAAQIFMGDKPYIDFFTFFPGISLASPTFVRAFSRFIFHIYCRKISQCYRFCRYINCSGDIFRSSAISKIRIAAGICSGVSANAI